MTPVSLDPFSYLIRGSIRKIETRRTVTCTYVVAKKAAIISKISESLFVVSLKPGVSMRITLLPSRVNLSASPTPAVHDSKPIPTRRLELLARLMNWRKLDEILFIIAKHTAHTVDFPHPVAPMTLW